MQILSISDILRATDGELIHKADGAEFIEVTEVTIDSRKAVDGVAFIPLKGEHADGHDFIGAALEHGASVALTEKDIDVHFGNVIKVKDTRKALGDIARYYKQKYPVPTVSITGSVGKTTTK
ncbi:MAG: Mur ligase domain-containing protein, partial [Clostridia bacterium]|nr:Mur ligase domain-containing protein [Clostridia bacterium]